MPVTTAFSFGRFEYRPSLMLLLRDGCPVRVGSRALALLDALLAAPGSIVPAARLVAAAWPATVVSEGNLRVQLMNLRRVLDEPGARSHVLTVPGRGFAFVEPVDFVAALPAARTGTSVHRRPESIDRG